MKQKYGVALFDDPLEYSAGWALMEGCEEPMRIDGTQDLSSSVIWWTNLDYQTMRDAGILNNARFRSDDFLRRKQSVILHQLGLRDSSVHEQVEALLTLLVRVVDICRKSSVKSLENAKMTGNLRRSITQPDPLLVPEMHKKINDTHKVYTVVQRHGANFDDPEYGSFLLPPLRHAKSLLNVPFPTGDWNRIKAKDIVQSDHPEAVLQWLLEQPYLFVAQVTISDISVIANEIMNFGKDINTSQYNRRWLTSIELAAIAGMVESIKIHDVWAASGIQDVADMWSFARTLRGCPEQWELSYSISLYAETSWCAMCSAFTPPRYNRRTSKKLPTNTMAPFIRALDRMQCMSRAFKLDGIVDGIHVHGYGTGKVVAEISEATDTQLFEAARECQMLPPRIDLKMTQTPEDFGDMLRCLYGLAGPHEILKVDRDVLDNLVIPEIEKKN